MLDDEPGDGLRGALHRLPDRRRAGRAGARPLGGAQGRPLADLRPARGAVRAGRDRERAGSGRRTLPAARGGRGADGRRARAVAGLLPRRRGEQRLARRYSYSDRSRYYWPDPEIDRRRRPSARQPDRTRPPAAPAQPAPARPVRPGTRGELDPAPRALALDRVRDVLRPLRRRLHADQGDHDDAQSASPTTPTRSRRHHEREIAQQPALWREAAVRRSPAACGASTPSSPRCWPTRPARIVLTGAGHLRVRRPGAGPGAGPARWAVGSTPSPPPTSSPTPATTSSRTCPPCWSRSPGPGDSPESVAAAELADQLLAEVQPPRAHLQRATASSAADPRGRDDVARCCSCRPRPTTRASP